MSASSQLDTFAALLRLLTSGREAGVLLIEDIHWADDPTLDLFRYLGRRLRSARLLVIATFRNDEAPSRERLAALWADFPAILRAHRAAAVVRRGGELAGGPLQPPRTGPVRRHGWQSLPRHGVPRHAAGNHPSQRARCHARPHCAPDLARAAHARLRLHISPHHRSGPAARAGRRRRSRRRRGMHARRDAPCNGEVLAFRHELARRAVHEAMAPLRRRELHAAALSLLKTREGVRAAELAHHAQQAGAVEDLVLNSQRARRKRRRSARAARVWRTWHACWSTAPGLATRNARMCCSDRPRLASSAAHRRSDRCDR